ncbi:hypothetical protein P170DRAFT_249646 [Aspergillus steynii IBT 23096]|uniref:Uncharacterized protein n=1 Tax=Aspergillus steynii IBT 23096 TaxID=1392250 RepID=A0A2I2FYH3_9EURO|nr:uncharacterized protein P170DRAFT_249646 [Aspergillus steynii IBT 23096]PLB45677.1 hypothetical protein P170DRAFT_249646 [Aspergillus steynii IBT 23096]
MEMSLRIQSRHLQSATNHSPSFLCRLSVLFIRPVPGLGLVSVLDSVDSVLAAWQSEQIVGLPLLIPVISGEWSGMVQIPHSQSPSHLGPRRKSQQSTVHSPHGRDNATDGLLLRGKVARPYGSWDLLASIVSSPCSFSGAIGWIPQSTVR